MANKQISVILNLKDKMSQPLVKVSGNVEKVTREMKKSQNQIERWKNNSIKAMDNFIGKSAKVAGAATALAGAFAVKMGFDGLVELDAGAAKVKSIAKDTLDYADIQKDLLKYSTKTGVGVEELAETQYSAISAGIKASDSMMASVKSSRLAIAGFTDSNSALKVLSSTMNVYGLTGEKAMDSISDKLLTTQNLGVTTVAELSEKLGDITPIAKSAGVGLDELLTGVASLTKGGMSTDIAVTKLKGVMTSFIKPTKEAKDMANQLGIDLSVAAIQSKGFGGVMEDIKAKTGGNTEIMGKLFGNVEALGAALSLTSDTGMADFNNILNEMKNSTGATDEAFGVMTGSIRHKLDKFKNTAKNAFTGLMNTQSGLIGDYVDKLDSWFESNQDKIQGWVDKVGSGISKVVEFIKSMFDFLQKNEKLITTVLVFVGALYAVIKVIGILKGVLVVLNTVWMIFNGTLVVSPLGWVILIIAALIAIGYALWRNWDAIKIKAFEVWEAIRNAFSPVAGFFMNLWEGVKANFKSFINFFISGVNVVIRGINKIKFKVPDWVPKVGGKQISASVAQIPAFAKGGIATGPSIFGEAGPEISIPLKKNPRTQGLLSKANEIIGDNTSSKTVNVYCYFTGVTVGKTEFFEEAGEYVAKKVKLAIDNSN